MAVSVGRRAGDQKIFCCKCKRGEKQLYPVKPGAAMNAQEPYRYDHKWVAEVEVIHPMDEFLRTMRRNSKNPNNYSWIELDGKSVNVLNINGEEQCDSQLLKEST